MMLEDEQARWRRVKELFGEAATLPAGERERFLNGACGGDDLLQREVRTLLAAHDEAGDLFERGPAAAAIIGAEIVPPATGHLAPGQCIGPYEIVEAIGAGGMGEVYRARDTRLHRDVALKILAPALVANPARRARFVQEARAASALEHPHIAVIHEITD